MTDLNTKKVLNEKMNRKEKAVKCLGKEILCTVSSSCSLWEEGGCCCFFCEDGTSNSIPIAVLSYDVWYRLKKGG